LIANTEGSRQSSEQIAGDSPSNWIVNRLDVPIKTLGRTVGVLSAINKTNGDFNQHDAALLSSVAGITALAMENIRIRESLAKYYRQMKDFSRAKDRVIHQLSHALKTPLAVLIASLKLLRKYTSASADTTWLNIYDRAQRNLARLLTIEYEMEDILRQRKDSPDDMTSLLSGSGDRPTARSDETVHRSDTIDQNG
jgi:K+-sensing histidine kinase KdpD